MFHVGQLVVCVEECHPSYNRHSEGVPRKGALYTIRDAFEHPIYHRPAVRLNEIVNKARQYAGCFTECSFEAVCFRPVDDSKLEIFRAMLTDKPVELVE